MKKIAIVLFLLLIAGAGIGYYVLKSGFGGADDWVVRRVVRIAQTYIEPQVEFTDFEWDGSKTITLKGVTLTADDGTKVVEAGAMKITTERVPINGGAFIIEAIELDDAILRLVQTIDPDGSIGFKGLVPFVKTKNITDQTQVDEEVRLSETFQIRRIDLKNGGFEYDAGDGSQPMRLAGITLDVDLTPEDTGAYALNVDLKRDKVFEIQLTSDMNLDTMELNNTDLTFDADLSSDEAVSAIPPQVQALLRKYEVKGQLETKIGGNLRLNDPTASDIDLRVRLSEGNVAAGEYKFPVNGANIVGTLANKRLNISDFDISMIGGLISLTRFDADLSADTWPADVAWDLRGLDIEELLRAKPTDGEPPKFAGILTLNGNASMSLRSVPDSISGKGTLTLRDGRLVSIPVISDLVDAMDVVASLTGTQTNKDTADITFTLDGKGIEMPAKGLQLSTQVMNVRGKGRINYDQTLNMSVNGGPVEKLQDSLGGVGDIIGAVTDGIVKYVIKGTTSDPKIEIKPLGIGG